MTLAIQLAGLSYSRSARAPQAPRIQVAPKYERMAAAYEALPLTGCRDTREIAAQIGASVHITNRALDRLVAAGRARKVGTRPAGNTFLNLWERA